MEPLIQLTRLDNGVEIWLKSVFPSKLCVELAAEDIQRLGQKLLRLLKPFNRRLKWRAAVNAKWGGFELEVLGLRYRSEIQLWLHYELPHRALQLISECESFYADISREAVLEFGKQLVDFKNSGSAILYGGAVLSNNPFYDEYNKRQ